MNQIEYTDLYVRDGDPNNAAGAMIQYWVAINTAANTKTSITTYDGDIRGACIENCTYDLKAGWQSQLKKYTVANGTSAPACFIRIGSEMAQPAPQHQPQSQPMAAPIQPTQPQPTGPINLAHPSISMLTFDDIDELFASHKFNTFIARIQDVAGKKFPYDQDAFNKLKGDIFEIFVEFLIKYQGRDPRIGITDYSPMQTDDFGVDGIGKSTRNGKPATVQVKYRQYPHIIHWNNDHIANFYNQSRGSYFDPIGFIPTDSVNMLIITSASAIHHSVDKFSFGKMRYITNDGLKELIDNMAGFWDAFKEALLAKKPTGPSPDPIKGKEPREHQRLAVDKIMKAVDSDEPRLVVEFPTGTGKTLIQAEVIRRCRMEKGFQCALIISPTILLTYQHITEIAEHLTANGIDAEYLNISSGDFDDEQIKKWKEERGMEANYIISTTNISTINEKYTAAKIKGKLLIISSTYQSVEKVRKAGIEAEERWRPDIQMNDEAHFLSTESGYYLGSEGEEGTYCALRVASNSFSFTATPTCGKAGIPHFMRWEDGRDSKGERIYLTNPLWGELFRMSPKELIEKGEMLRPVAHLVDTTDQDGNSQRLERNRPAQGQEIVDDRTYFDELWRCIEQSYNFHREYMHGISADASQMAPKLLVTLNSQETMIRILGGELLKKGHNDNPNSPDQGKTVPLRVMSGLVMHDENGKAYREGCPSFQRFLDAKPADMHVFAIASSTGAYIDGEWQGTAVDKGQFLRRLKEVPDTEGAIILYVDMLTEGIDVPGITGFMPMRNIGYSKFKQGMGRASRLFKADRMKFYRHEIGDTLKDAKNYVKPHSAIIIPMALVSVVDAADEYLKIWREILDEYGAFYEFIISSSRVGGTVKRSVLDSTQELAKLLKESQPGVRRIIQGVFDDPQMLRLDIDSITAVEFIDKFGTDVAKAVFEKVGFDASLGKSSCFTDSISTLKLKAVVNQSYDIDFERMVKTARNSGQGVFSDAIKSKFGTIYTPENIVTMTVDLAFKHLDKTLDRTKLRYCDPAAGDGNFFQVLYKRLMADEQFVARFPDPIERSYHIITENIWGFEILKNMWLACRIRLVMMHFETVKANNGDCAQFVDIVDKLHIYHGNTIKSPKDDAVYTWEDKKTGKSCISPDPKIGEGDVLPMLWVKNERNKWVVNPEMKFDVIVGNPPYTHLRNLDNRRYSAYPKQRDLAQVFVRWAFHHLTENGVCSFNTTDKWLNTKTSDGAEQTREEIEYHLCEVIQDENIKSYSVNDGGDNTTFVVAFTSQERPDRPKSFVLNGKAVSYQDICKPNLLTGLQAVARRFPSVPISTYISSLSSAIGDPLGVDGWEPNISVGSGSRSYIGFSRMYRVQCFRLITDEPSLFKVGPKGQSEIKYITLPTSELTIWLLGYLNTQENFIHATEYATDKGGGLWQVNWNVFQFCQVPDLDWYKINKPIETQNFLDWVSQNMSNKDAFLAGIDAQFAALIA